MGLVAAPRAGRRVGGLAVAALDPLCFLVAVFFFEVDLLPLVFLGVALLVFLAAVFLRVVFLTAVFFLAAVFLRVVFLTAVFFRLVFAERAAGGFLAVFLAPVGLLARVFLLVLLAADDL
ncbi:MAG: hypothetical protein ACRDJ2_04190 [Actinomycetota bacterium]